MGDGDRSPDGVLSAQFNTPVRYAVLLVAEGAPESTDWWSVFSFLSRKLTNPRFYDFLPRWLWYPLVYAVVLPSILREQQRMYQSTWIYSSRRSSTISSAEEPSGGASRDPGVAAVVSFATQLAHLLEKTMQRSLSGRPDVSVQVEVAFHHRKGSVEAALNRLHLRGSYGSDARDSSGAPVLVVKDTLLVLPLCPHHKADVTGTVWDAVMGSAYFRRHHSIPHVRFVRSYAEREAFVDAWHRHIRRYVGHHGTPDWLFLVFEGTSRCPGGSGDTYREEYTNTVLELRDRLSTPWPHSASIPAVGDGPFYRGAFAPNRITTGFFGRGSEALQEPRVELAFLSIIRQLKSISANNSCLSGPLDPLLGRDGEGSASSSTMSASRTPLPLDMAPTALVACPGEALDDVTTLWKLERELFPVFRRLGWRDVQYIPALNATDEHAEMLSRVLEPYVQERE